jgi:hypothetical protein
MSDPFDPLLPGGNDHLRNNYDQNSYQYPDPTDPNQAPDPFISLRRQQPQYGDIETQPGVGFNQSLLDPMLFENTTNVTPQQVPQQSQYGFGRENEAQYGFGQGGSFGQEATQHAFPNTQPENHYCNSNSGNGGDNKQFQHYLQMQENETAALTQATRGSAGQQVPGQELRAPTCGSGINDERVPDVLLPLYNNIPVQMRTREYWMRLVEESRNNPNITPQLWVDEMVRQLRIPTTHPGTLLGWTRLTVEWRLFFLTSVVFFSPGNITPMQWISMVQHMDSTLPEVWYSQLPAALPPQLEEAGGDPSTYLLHNVPSISTAASQVVLNLAARGPIPPDLNFNKRPFKGKISRHPEYWGNFVDDGPPKASETSAQAVLRIRWSRSNMGIIRRPREKLPPMTCIYEPVRAKQISAERLELSKAIRLRNDRALRNHERKMDETSPKFDPAYRDKWRQQQRERREENNRRRVAAHEHRARYYRHMNLPVPPRPAPPEDSDGDIFFDPVEPGLEETEYREEDLDENMTSEPYRCQPCAEERLACSYQMKRFPCTRCITEKREHLCVLSQPKRKHTSLRGHPYGGPFIPSFAMLQPRVEHQPFPPVEQGIKDQ